MLSVVKLIVASLLPVILSALLALLDKKHPVNTKKEYILRQTAAGLFFGCLAVVGTEWGIPINGAMINCRDGAVLCAGLLFGGPAGIIAGLIGGIERWIAVAWGVGSFTRVACTVSTIIAGFYSAFCRKYLFEGKRPIWTIALGCGLVMEVFHLSMVFITNMSETTKALETVRNCTIPMIASNSLAVMLATMLVSYISGDRLSLIVGAHTPLSTTIQRWLMVCVSLVFLISTTFVYYLQENIAFNDIKVSMNLAIDDVSQGISDASDAHLLQLAHLVAKEIDDGDDNLYNLSKKYEVSEINVVNQIGIIIKSTNPYYVGFDMTRGIQSGAFLCLLHGATEYTQPYGPISIDHTVEMKYVGVKISGGFVQLGFDADAFQSDIDNQVKLAAVNRHVGQTGVLVIADDNDIIVSGPEQYIGTDMAQTPFYDEYISAKEGVLFESEVVGENYITMFRRAEGYSIIALETRDEAFHMRNVSVYVTDFLLILIFGLMFALLYRIVRNRVVSKVDIINDKLTDITNGKLDTVLDVNSNEEFTRLSGGINKTVDALKGYIKEAEERMAEELEMAQGIQQSVLPSVFPAYPRHPEIDIYAMMDPAKEVGGDFYDFYFSRNKTFNFLVADVSGKGIPAALFMMRAKTQLKSLTESGAEVCDVFSGGNDGLSEGNDAMMFVTAWQAQFLLENQVMHYVNAGHNPPLVKHEGGSFEYMRQRSGPALGVMAGVPYKLQTLEFKPGDTIFLYTDGVTEATSLDEELYGEDRLLSCINSVNFSDMKELCELVKADVDKFVGKAPQFDDITMLAFKFIGFGNAQ